MVALSPPLPPPVPALVAPAVSVGARRAGSPGAVSLDLKSASVPDLVRLLCRTVDRPRFVLSPGVVGSDFRLTLSLAGSAAEVWSQGVEALRLAGFGSRCLRSGLCEFFTLPPAAPAAKPEVPLVVLAYVPRFRDVAFLGQSLTGMFSGWHFAGASASASSQAAGAVSAAVTPSSGSGSGGGGGAVAGHAQPSEAVPARLVGLGPLPDRARVLAALAALDRPVPALVVRLGVYEVDVSASNQSALSVVAAALGQTVSLGVTGPNPLSGALGVLSLKVGSFSAVVAALDSASRVHLVT